MPTLKDLEKQSKEYRIKLMARFIRDMNNLGHTAPNVSSELYKQLTNRLYANTK